MCFGLSIGHLKMWSENSSSFFLCFHISDHLSRPRATGVATTMVESMEVNLKEDVLRELKAGNGRILLHDEVEERLGVFSIVPIWETVSPDEIMTPRDVFDMMAQEGFKVSCVHCKSRCCEEVTFYFQIDYDRVAIVSFAVLSWSRY